MSLVITGLNRTSEQFYLRFASSDFDAVREAGIFDTVKEWQEVMHERAQESVTFDDEDVARDYSYYCKKIEEQPEECGEFFMLLKDASDRIQALATLTEQTHALQVKILLSAAWNVPMSFSPHAKEKVKSVKRAATTLMRQIYELARKKQKKKIELSSMQSSHSYYRDHLKMKPLARGRLEFYFDVTETETPETLDIPAGNLLSSSHAHL